MKRHARCSYLVTKNRILREFLSKLLQNDYSSFLKRGNGVGWLVLMIRCKCVVLDPERQLAEEHNFIARTRNLSRKYFKKKQTNRHKS